MAHLSALLQVAFDRLASKAVNDYFRREKLDVKLLKNLKMRMLAINQFIDDAEEKETTNVAVKEWLDEVKDVVFDAEDVFDVIAAQALENDQVSSTTIPWNPFDRSLHQKLEDVFDRMQFLFEQKDDFGLKPSTRSNSKSTTFRMPTTSLVEQSSVYGRDDDKEEIKKLLLSNDDGSNGDVIAIVGMGGLGKTTLAQLVFNDYEIKGVFKLNKVWICVAEDFDVIKITKTILEKFTSQAYATNDFDELQMKLRDSLLGKRFLIALDDVWNENYSNWDNLRKPFVSAAPGSKIIITTRSERVASAMRATSTYKLKPLLDEACWLLFSKHAFENIQSNAYSTFEALGRELVKKCGGLPLAAKVLGGLVGTKLGYEEWHEVLKSEIWDLSDEASDNNILSVLRLSYHYLPSNLKRCFSFCSIVPKDFNFEREKLVLLWMAENLLQDSKSQRRIDVGYEYLRELESRSLIQSSTEGDLYFSMHDLVNDLAKFVSGVFYKSFDLENSFNGGEKTRHFSYEITSDIYDLTKFKGVSEAKGLRTFLPLVSKYAWINVITPQLRSEIWPQLNVLRSLTLPRADIEKLPDSIGNLKLLRYLDLSENFTLNQLPESVASLYNLEVLNLTSCLNLTKLPREMRQLIKLNYLNIRATTLQEMPSQMGRLKDLDVLTDFVVGKGSGSSIGELKELKNLRGELFIHGLENISYPKDALEANLKEKLKLETMCFAWEDNDSDNSEDARIILENLRPHVNLKKLYINGYSGTRLPDWSGHNNSFTNLVDFEVYGFKHCFDLSPLGKLLSLKSLSIYKCPKLVTLVGTEIPVEFHHHVGHFSALVKLHIESCDSLVTLIPVELPNEIHHRVGHFSALVKLHIKSCDSLVTLIPVELSNGIHHHVGHFSALVELGISGCRKLELPQQHHCLTSIEHFQLENGSCASLQFFPVSLFSKLKKLKLLNLQSIKSLAVIDEANNINLESIDIGNCSSFDYFTAGKWCAPNMTELSLCTCKSLKILPENMCNLFPSLLRFELSQCPNLEALPQSGLPSSLSTLIINRCDKLIANHSSWGLQRLLSLSHFEIRDFECHDLESFPEEGLLPSSLSTLKIWNLQSRNLNGKSFQFLTSLETLQLDNCRKLQCLPEEGLPTSLSTLEIWDCPRLESRCQREQGEDWSKIAHIPNIDIRYYP